MRIGIEVQRLFRKKRFGIETSAIELIHALYRLKTNHEIIVLAKEGDNTQLFEGCSNFKIRHVSGRFFFDFEQFHLPLAVQHEKLDILHCTGNTTPIFCKKPVIQTLHDIIFMDSIPGSDTLYQRAGNHYRRLIVPMSIKKSKAIITVSHYEKQRIIERFNLDEKKVHVIHHGINPRFKKTTNPLHLKATQMKYKLPNEFILFLGNTSFRKNSDRVLEAYTTYAQMTQSPLPLVTPGLPNDFVLSYLTKKGLARFIDHIYTPGYIDDKDLVHLYSLGKLFLFPSLSEGFGMPLLEAMACELPVITSTISCLPEIAGNAAFLIDPYSAVEMGSAIFNLLENQNLLEKLSKKGLLQAQQYQWNGVAEKTMELYEQVNHEALNPTKKTKYYEFQVA